MKDKKLPINEILQQNGNVMVELQFLNIECYGINSEGKTLLTDVKSINSISHHLKMTRISKKDNFMHYDKYEIIIS